MATPESNLLDAASPLEPSQPLAVATGSAVKGHELDTLLRAAKVLDGEARTWCEGFAVKRGKCWVWNKEYEWAQLRAMHCTSSANSLRAMHKRFMRPQDSPDDLQARYAVKIGGGAPISE